MSDENITVLPGLDRIGYGYNVFGKYADKESCTVNLFQQPDQLDGIFSFRGNEYVYPKNFITVTSIDSSNDKYIYGKSVSEYTSSLNTETGLSGNYGFFSASISVDFDRATRTNTNNSFITVRWVNKLWQIDLPYDTLLPALRPRLAPQFANDLMQMSPDDLFITYGTHYVARAFIGGRADANSVISSTAFSDTQQLQIAATMSYAGLRGSLSVKDKTAYQTQIDTFNMKSMRTSSCVGGDSSLEENVLNEPDDFKAWSATILDQPELCDFDAKSLKGIWTLCSDPARRTALEAAYRKFTAYRLQYQMINTLEPCGNDQGSGAKGNVSFFRPQPASLVQEGYYWVGHYAQGSYGDLQPKAATMIIRPHDNQPGATAPPTGWVQVWGDHGSGRANDYSLWAPIPPTDYRALGHLARFNTSNYDAPSGAEVDRFVCVHKSLVTEAVAGDPVWNDKGSGSAADGAIWRAIPADADAGVASGTFYATQGYGTPPQPLPTVYCLKTSAVDDVNA
ncbi:Vps62-related protein [Azospirillum sp. HJ39]|uniref:Vps62-related protein n=1 Tax=Azospirillum sp. HJ39 TaxID=3159496 RepID=UPI003558F0A5